MFNYSNLSTKLSVTPEISPSILKDYVKDIPASSKNVIYGRTNGQWVPVGGSKRILKFGFNDAGTLEELSANDFEKFKQLEDAISMETATMISISVENMSIDNTLWLCCENEITSVKTVIGNIPMSFTTVGDLTYEEKTYHCYSVAGLSTTIFDLLVEMA